MSDPVMNSIVFCAILIGITKGLVKLNSGTTARHGPSANILDFLFNNRL